MKLFIFAALFATVLVYSIDGKIANKTYRVTTILSPPFASYTDENILEGLTVDITKELEKLINIKTKIVMVQDGKYGSQEADGTWNGMMGELVRREVDFAVAPLTITSKREREVDFTKPFMSTGVMALTRAQTVGYKPSYFLVLEPFTAEVWFIVVAGFVAFCIVLFLINCFNPREWRNAAANGKGTPRDGDTLNIFNSFWFGVSTLTWQGYERQPRSLAGRVLVVFWFFFVLCILLFYTAGMISIISYSKGEKKMAPFFSVDDIGQQSALHSKIYVLEHGSTHQFFQTSKIALYERINEMLETVKSMDSALEKIREDEKGVFFGESVTLKYQMNQHPCDLIQVGELLNSAGYGVASPFGSPLKDELNVAILKMRERGTLAKLEKKWFYDKSACATVSGPDSEAEWASSYFGGKARPRQVNLHHFAGVAMVLAGGIVLAILVLIVEIIVYWFRHKPPSTGADAAEAEEGEALKEEEEKGEEKAEEAPLEEKEADDKQEEEETKE